MGVFVNYKPKKGAKDVHPSITNKVSLQALGDGTVRNVGLGKEKGREKKREKKREYKI